MNLEPAALRYHAPSTVFIPSRPLAILFLSSVALVPWTWFPPFPWLHEHAQWSDATFACTAGLWLFERLRFGSLRFASRLPVIFAALYLAGATGSLIAHGGNGVPKLLGLGELCAILVIGADLTGAPVVAAWLGRVVGASAVLNGALAVAGLALFYAGIDTQLVGTYGDLVESPLYARMQVGMFHPNLLASYTIFAAAIVAAPQSALSPLQRRVAMVAMWVTIALTFSRAALGFAYAAHFRWALAGSGRMRRASALASAVAALAAMALLTRWNLVIDPSHWWSARLVQPTINGRWLNIPASLRVVAANPWWGCGLDCGPAELPDGVRYATHLTWINIAATLGLPALASFVAIVVSTWRARSRPTNVALWSGFAGLLVDSLACDFENFRHVWLLLGCLNARPDTVTASAMALTSEARTSRAPGDPPR